MSIHRIPEELQCADLMDARMKDFWCIRDYVSNLRERVKERRGLFITGPPHVDKAYAMAALSKHVDTVTRGISIEFMPFRELLRHISVLDTKIEEDQWDEYRGQSWEDTFKTCPWFVVDDVGGEYRRGGAHEVVCNKFAWFLYIRNANRRITHFTSCLSLKGEETISAVYNPKIASMLRSMVDPAYIVGGKSK